MKKIYLVFVFVGFFLSSYSQFLMKSGTHLLREGDEHYFNITNNVDPGNAGADLIWDFSNLETKSQLTSYMYSAYTTEKSANIPEVNTVLEEFETKFYFKTSDDIIEQFGTVSKNNTVTKYDKPFVKMVFPFNYGDNFVSDFSGTIEGANNYKASFSGTCTLNADAYGTIILPGNVIYKNVFRIKTEKEQYYNNSNSCNCSTISYKWYSRYVRYPLLTIIQSKSSQGIKTIRTAYYSKAKNSDIINNKSNSLNAENLIATIYPNPFKDEFKLDYTITIDSDVIIEVYDNSGKKISAIHNPKQKAGYYTETINLKEFGNQLGLFHIRLIAGNNTVSKTVIRAE